MTDNKEFEDLYDQPHTEAVFNKTMRKEAKRLPAKAQGLNELLNKENLSLNEYFRRHQVVNTIL